MMPLPGPAAYLVVAVGGAAGAVARFGLTALLQRGHGLPLGTLAANLLGCLLMGAVVQGIASNTWLATSGAVPEQYRLLFAVGFCGSFTTLSALAFEFNALLERNETLLSLSYLFASLLGGFACFLLGALLVRSLLGNT